MTDSLDAPAALNRIQLKSSDFRLAREATWRELETLLARTEATREPQMSPDELLRLPELYWSALSSLSVARSIAIDMNLEAYLENLCLRAFLGIHAQRVRAPEMLRSIAIRVPAAFVALRLHVAIALGTVLLGAITGYSLVAQDPLWASAILSTDTLGHEPTGSLAANFFGHALPLTLLAVGLGVFLALPTLALLAWQGVYAGAFVAAHLVLHAQFGTSPMLVTALTFALILAGSAGLRLAQAILLPGPLRRVDSLALATTDLASITIVAIVVLAALTCAA